LTADKWEITLVEIFKPSDNVKRKSVFFLDSINSDASYWAHHQIIYDLYNKGFRIWLGNTRYSRGFNSKTSFYSVLGSINEVAIHDIPAQISFIMKKYSETSVRVVTHGTGASAFAFALGKYEEATLTFYNNFRYQFAVSKIVAIAPCPISSVGKPADDVLISTIDKVNWNILTGSADDICPVANVETFFKKPL
jgi:hypothetical protein